MFDKNEPWDTTELGKHIFCEELEMSEQSGSLPVDLDFVRKVAHIKANLAEIRTSLTQFQGIRPCKTITDFLAFHNARDTLSLTREQRAELLGRMNALFTLLESTARAYCATCGVPGEAALSQSQRAFYYAELGAVVCREDHYP